MLLRHPTRTETDALDAAGSSSLRCIGTQCAHCIGAGPRCQPPRGDDPCGRAGNFMRLAGLGRASSQQPLHGGASGEVPLPVMTATGATGRTCRLSDVGSIETACFLHVAFSRLPPVNSTVGQILSPQPDLPYERTDQDQRKRNCPPDLVWVGDQGPQYRIRSAM
jgi:hypothetical protein